LDEARIAASVKIIGNALEKRPLYELMKIYSSEADLIFVGIPDVEENEVKDFVANTNDLVHTIGTTLLVKASSQFDDISFITTDGIVEPWHKNEVSNQLALPQFIKRDTKELNSEISKIENEFKVAANQLIENAFGIIQEKYYGFYQMLLSELKPLENPAASGDDIYQMFSTFLQHLQTKLHQLRTEELSVINEIFADENREFLDNVNVLLKKAPSRLKFQNRGVKRTVRFRKTAQVLSDKILISSLRNTYLDFGNNSFENLIKTSDEVIAKTYSLFELEGFYQNNSELKEEIIALTAELTSLMQKQMKFFKNLTDNLELEIFTAGRNYCNALTTTFQSLNFDKELKKLQNERNRKVEKKNIEEVLFFPLNWGKNQEVIHTSMETNLKLAEAI